MNSQKPIVGTETLTRSRLDVEERRRQLVELGIKLFAETTYDNVSIDELAQVAGISKGLLYHYFPTKRDFYVATVREASQQLLDRTVTPEGMVPTDRLRAGLEAFLDYVSDHGKAYQALLRSGVGSDTEVAAIVDETREALCARLVQGVPGEMKSPSLRVVLRGWLGFVEAATIEWLDGKSGLSRETLRSMNERVLIDALAAAAE